VDMVFVFVMGVLYAVTHLLVWAVGRLGEKE
jgi:hypothetical protein